MFFFRAILIFLFFGHTLSASFSAYDVFLRGFTFRIGPSFAQFERKREGGSRQSSLLPGGEFEFERRKKGAFYLNVNGLLFEGDLNGDAPSGVHVISSITDKRLEGRLGYSIKYALPSSLEIIPFLALGKIETDMKIKEPKAFSFRFIDRVDYSAVGVLFEKGYGRFSYGGCFKALSMIEGFEKIKDDPFFGNPKLCMSNRWFYEIEAFVKKKLCLGKMSFTGVFKPFYLYRDYGKRENFPFDFYTTTYRIYGVSFLIEHAF